MKHEIQNIVIDLFIGDVCSACMYMGIYLKVSAVLAWYLMYEVRKIKPSLSIFCYSASQYGVYVFWSWWCFLNSVVIDWSATSGKSAWLMEDVLESCLTNCRSKMKKVWTKSTHTVVNTEETLYVSTCTVHVNTVTLWTCIYMYVVHGLCCEHSKNVWSYRVSAIIVVCDDTSDGCDRWTQT